VSFVLILRRYMESKRYRLVGTLTALGLPALAAPRGSWGQTPVGVQIVASRYREDLCLSAGEAIEARGTPLAPIDPRN
jgi:amidase